MAARQGWIILATIFCAASASHALTPPSDSDGPVKLLSCVVTAGVLEAAVDSRSDEAMTCDIRCNYELGERMFSHTFTETIPARFQGRVGRFDTHNAKAGSYSGEVGHCNKVTR